MWSNDAIFAAAHLVRKWPIATNRGAAKFWSLLAGPLDIIMVPGVVSHIEFMHEMAGYTAASVAY
jgi:hypothetical protein